MPDTVTVRAPGRVDLIGDHTDYAGGLALPFAIDRGVDVFAEARADHRLVVSSLRLGPEPVDLALPDLSAGAVAGWAGYIAGAAWALSRSGMSVPGATVTVGGDLPDGAGLSSSAALCCAAVAALAALAGASLNSREVADLAYQAEHDFVGVPCGRLDQLAICCSPPGGAILVDFRDLSLQPVPLTFPAAGLTVVVLDTGVRRAVGGGAYGERRRAAEGAAQLLGRDSLADVAPEDAPAALDELAGEPSLRQAAKHVFSENERVRRCAELLEAGKPDQIGALLTASHASLRDDLEVSTAELDAAVDSALAAGALGARLIGAGFGGCAIALTPVEAVGAVIEAAAVAGVASAWPTHPDHPLAVDVREPRRT